MESTAIGAAIGGGIGLMNTVLTNKFAQARTDRDRQQNYAYNELSAENAYNRQRALMEEYMTPEAQIRHLKAAGLSPSIMYGAGGGTQGVSTPAGNGGGNIQTPTSGMDLTAITQLANIGLIKAQTEKTKAETETEAGTNQRGEAEIKKIFADAGATEAQTEFTKVLKKGAEIDNLYKNEINESNVGKIQAETEYYNELCAKTFIEAKHEKVQCDFDEATFETRKQQFEEDLHLTLKQILLTDSQTKLNAKELDQMDRKLQLLVQGVDLKQYEIAVKSATTWKQLEQAQEHLQIDWEQLGINQKSWKWSMGIDAAKTALQAAATVYALKGFAGGTAKLASEAVKYKNNSMWTFSK